MKRRASLLLGLALAGPLAAQDPDEGQARDRAKAALVVHAAAVQVVEETGRLARPAPGDEAELVPGLARAMLEQPARHRRLDDSRAECLDTLARLQRERVEGVISQAVALARQQSPLPVSAEQVLAKAGAGAAQLAERALAGWKTNGVDRLLQEARRRAVDQQRGELDGQLQYPPADRLDTMLLELARVARDPSARLPRAAWDRVRERMARPPADGPARALFEENERYLQGASTRMAEAIRLQYEEQLAGLEAAAQRDRLPRAAITLPALAEHLHGGVERAVAGLSPESGAPRYGVLAVVRSNTVARAASLEEELLAGYVRGEAPAAVTVEQLAELVRARPDRYRAAAGSLPDAVRELAADWIPSLASGYAGRAGVPAAAPRVETVLQGGGAAGDAVRERVRAEAEAGWAEARARVAAEQVRAHFPGLADDAPLAAEQADRACDFLQPFPATFTGLVAALRGFAAGWIAPEQAPLLEETEARVTERARLRVELACGAQERQLALLRQLETDRLPALERDVAADRPLRAILKEWSDELARRWTEPGGPGPAAYPDLLPRTLDLLNKTVRQLYDARRQEQAAERRAVAARAGAEASADQVQAAPVEARPDEFQAQATATEDPDDQPPSPPAPEPKKRLGLGAVEYVWKTEPDAVLMVRDTRWRRAQVVLLDGAQNELSSASFRPDRTDDAADDIYAMIAPALTRALDARRAGWTAEASGGEGEAGPSLKVFLLVQSREIRHLTSLKLRHLMQQQVDAWSEQNRPGQPPVNLVWIVGL